jgi:hypothetical protein
MKPEAYKRLRESVGSQRFVAKRLGVHWRTIGDRENGRFATGISREVEYGLRYLAQVVSREQARGGG